MARPDNFVDDIDYFEDAVAFLTDHSWIYQHANVSVLCEGVLRAFPKSFSEYFLTVGNAELNRFPFVTSEFMVLECAKLRKFRAETKRLLPKLCYQKYPHNAQPVVNKRGQHKISNKKFHEVTHLSERIDEFCHDTDVLIDCGCGLGYLSEALYVRNPVHLILGLECDKERVIRARERRTQIWKGAKDAVVYKQHYVKLDSVKFMEKEVEEIVSNNLPVPPSIECTKVGIIGLHSCADLSVTSMQLFLDMPIMRRLIIMPCCYHKMEVSEEDNKSLINFPLSEALKTVAARNPKLFKACFNRSFLRLACQQTAARWAQTPIREHSYHGEQMYYRAVAEAIIDRGTEIVVKLKSWRRSYSDHRNLPRDFKSLTQHYELRSKQNKTLYWTEKHQTRFYNLIEKYDVIKGPRLMEGLTCLQTTIQRLCENIVLYDRLCYMREYAENKKLLVTAHYEKILNEKLSPRCFALIAEKEIVPSELNLTSSSRRNSSEFIKCEKMEE